MTKQQFLEATVSQVSQVYKGKRACCRCGCGGDYVATSFMDKPRTDEINDKLVARRLKQAQKLILEGRADVDYGGTYVDVETGWDRSLTFYFDEIKN
jgi:hypothetical protein